MMNGDLFAQRLIEATLSRWNWPTCWVSIPHELHGVGSLSGLVEQPVRVLIELARRLDMHLVDIVGDLEPLLTNSRAPGVQVVIDSQDSSADPTGRDATRVLTALASASLPVTLEDPAAVLGWSLQRTVEVLQYAQAHPELGGPVALRRVPPDAWTVTARSDVLTPAQHQTLIETTRYRVPLTEGEVAVLLAVLTHGAGPGYVVWREQHLDAEHDLKSAGLVDSPTGPHHARLHPDVQYGLDPRYDVPVPSRPVTCRAAFPPGRQLGLDHQARTGTYHAKRVTLRSPAATMEG